MKHEVEQGRTETMDNKVIYIENLTPATDYIIRIRAVNGAGSSATAEYEISTSLVFKGGNQPEINWLKFNYSSL